MINLMPPDFKKALQYATRNTMLLKINFVLVGIIVAMAGVVAFGVAIVNSDENNLRESVASKEAQLATYEETIAEAQELANTIDTINTLIEQEENFSQLLRQIGSLMPDGSRLTALSLTNDREQRIQITAVTDTQKIATTLQTNLAESELFTGADIQSISANLDNNGNPSNYSVIIVTAFSGGDEPATSEDQP